jgi:hypothetical protein
MAIQDGDWVTAINEMLLDIDIWDDEMDRKFAAIERDWPKAQAMGMSVKEWRAYMGLDPDWGEPLTAKDQRSVEKYAALREQGINPATGKPLSKPMDPKLKWGLIAAGALGLLWFVSRENK